MTLPKANPVLEEITDHLVIAKVGQRGFYSNTLLEKAINEIHRLLNGNFTDQEFELICKRIVGKGGKRQYQLWKALFVEQTEKKETIQVEKRET